jgi:hypothetical protein
MEIEMEKSVRNIDHTEITFEDMVKGSFYTITGVGGDITEWVDGYEKMLAEVGLPAPEYWIQFLGYQMNIHFGLTGTNRYKHDLNFLAFPIENMSPQIGILAKFKIVNEDRWFDDIVQNNSRREGE